MTFKENLKTHCRNKLTNMMNWYQYLFFFLRYFFEYFMFDLSIVCLLICFFIGNKLIVQLQRYENLEIAFETEKHKWERQNKYETDIANEKLSLREKNHQEMMKQCQFRMESVLHKKDMQIKKLNRLLEKTIADYEKDKENTTYMFQSQSQQLQQLSQQLQL